MSQGDEHTLQQLRALKANGKLSANAPLDAATARDLLRTPPSSLLTRNELDRPKPLGAPLEPITEATLYTTSTHGGASTTDDAAVNLVKLLQEDVDAFNMALEDNTRLAKEQMQRSLLQLFEDTVREKLADTFRTIGGSGAHTSRPRSVVGTVANTVAPSGSGGPGRASLVSRRPLDRGLDKRDAPSEYIVPDNVREAINQDIYVVVDHELKKFFSVVSTDIGHIVAQVLRVKDRMCKIEEQLMQFQVDNRMQAEQLASSSTQISELQSEISMLRQHNADKDHQMDILREQISRRNLSLDETRVKFRKEVMRYKSRIYELEVEVENLSGKKKAHERRVSMGGQENLLADDGEAAELSVVASTAVQNATDKFNEEKRLMQLQAAKERRALMSEMNLKLSERDNEIIRMKAKVQSITEELEAAKSNIPSAMNNNDDRAEVDDSR